MSEDRERLNAKFASIADSATKAQKATLLEEVGGLLEDIEIETRQAAAIADRMEWPAS